MHFPSVRDARLSLYASASNESRIAELSQAPPPSSRTTRPAGVSVIILNLDRPDLIIPLVESLLRQSAAAQTGRVPMQVVIGDTGSTDPAVLDFYRRHAGAVTVVQGLRYHFSRCNNLLARDHARYATLLFLNNDIVFPPDGETVVADMYRALTDSPRRLGALGLQLHFPDGTIQHAGIDFFREPALRGFCFHPHARERAVPGPRGSLRSCPAVTGACLMTPADAFEAAGGMDEGYAAECQDVALCLALHRLGWDSAVLDAGEVVHIENGTRPKGDEHWPDRQRFLRRWGAYVEATFL